MSSYTFFDGLLTAGAWNEANDASDIGAPASGRSA
jgi:hypothetical protein